MGFHNFRLYFVSGTLFIIRKIMEISDKTKKIALLSLLSAVVIIPTAVMLTPSCTILDTGNNKQAIEVVAMAAASQAVYTSIEKEPKMIEVYSKVVDVLKRIEATVDMTPEQISSEVCKEISSVVSGDYKFIVDGLIQSLFTKYNIGWKDTINKDEIKGYLSNLVIAVEVAIEEHSTKE